MRLANGIIVDTEKTLGELKFSALRRERMMVDEEGKVTGEVKERTYDLRSKGQRMMIQVSIPAEAGAKEIDPGTPVKLVNAVFDTVVEAGYNGVEVEWYIKADDIVAVSAAAVAGGSSTSGMSTVASSASDKEAPAKKDVSAKN